MTRNNSSVDMRIKYNNRLNNRDQLYKNFKEKKFYKYFCCCVVVFYTLLYWNKINAGNGCLEVNECLSFVQ